MDVIKVKPWGKNQGDYVLINAEDFDPAKHELYELSEHKNDEKIEIEVKKTRSKK